MAIVSRDLQQLIDGVLADELPEGLKAAIDAARARGASCPEILRRIRAQAGARSVTYSAAAAYLAR